MTKKKKKKPNPIAQALTAMRNKKLSPARRQEIASLAARTRWGKPSKPAGRASDKKDKGQANIAPPATDGSRLSL